MISVVLGTYNRKHFLKLTIKSIRHELHNIRHEIIVVDGGSTDGTLNWLCKQKDILTIIQHNRGIWKGNKIQTKSWGYFMNLGFKSSSMKYICMLSDDCLIVPGAIVNAINKFENELNNYRKIGAIAFYWRNWPDQNKYWVGLTLGKKMFVNHGIYLKKALEDVDYIDENNFKFYHADGDLCLKLWQHGYECIESEDSYIEHYTHANKKVRGSNNLKQSKDWENYLNKWNGIYYFPENDWTGGWLEKEFIDKNKTYKKFILKYLLSILFIKNIYRKIRKIIHESSI